MHNMTIETVAKACGGKIIGNIEEIASIEVKGFCIDNRKVRKDYVFIPIVGKRVDGHEFIETAFSDGALFVLSQKKLKDGIGPYVLVESSEQALKKIAAFYRKQLDIPIVGVVGSVGKTGTKEMIASALSERFRVCKTEGNLNNEIGLPLTLLSIQPHHGVAVVEMGISDFGEMHRLGEMAQPTIVVMTNIEPCHLEQLKDLKGVLRAKSEIFEHLAPDATVILNNDDAMLTTIRGIKGAKIMTYGVKEGSDIRASKVESMGLDGVKFNLSSGTESWSIEVPVPGEHRIYHAMAAACVGLTLGLSMQEIRCGIEKTQGVAGRTNFIHLKNNIIVIDDCYNASPVSMKAALKLLAQSKGIKVAALGDMGELGENEVDLHREVGEYLATLPIDQLYTAGPLAKEIANVVEKSESTCLVRSFDTRDAFEAELVFGVNPDTCILVKASHFMGFSKVVASLVENIGREENT